MHLRIIVLRSTFKLKHGWLIPSRNRNIIISTVYPKKYAHGFVVLCFVVVMQSCIMNSHEVCIHIHQGCFAGTGAIVRLPQCQWSEPDGYGKISQCITTTKHSKAKPCAYFVGYTVLILAITSVTRDPLITEHNTTSHYFRPISITNEESLVKWIPDSKRAANIKPMAKSEVRL